MIKIEDLILQGIGSMDMFGEYSYLKGRYTSSISKKGYAYELNHNYYADICKFKSRWIVLLSLCLTASNSQNISLLDTKCKTLKAAKEKIVEFINEYDVSKKALEDIENWKLEHCIPVFIMKDNKMKLIGSTYSSCYEDSKDNNYYYGDKTDNRYNYYNDDIPNYDSYKFETHNYYELSYSYRGLYMTKYNMFYLGYSSAGFKDDNILNQMLEIIKDIPKYKYLLDKNLKEKGEE